MIPIIDMHCDTISSIHDRRLSGQEIALRENELHIDLGKLKNTGYMCQNFALFTFLGHWLDIPSPYKSEAVTGRYNSPREYALALSETLDKEISANNDVIRYALTAADIEDNHRNGFVSALKTIEEGAVFEGNTEVLRDFYDRGVRMTTLTWNFENELAYPNHINPTTGETTPDTERGLKKAGKAVVEACKDLGIIVDISHLNDAGIYDIFDIYGSSQPIVASHSNARSLTGHARNLTDDMLKKLGECGGVVGINFCADFINSRGDNNTLISDIVNHINYIVDKAGIEALGLGSDFDGIDNGLEFKDCSGMQKIAEALLREGYSDSDIKKIFYKNVLRVYRDVLRK